MKNKVKLPRFFANDIYYLFVSALSGTIFATFLSSLTKVCGHCISVQLTGTIGVPYGPDSAAIATTTPNSFSAVLN